MQKKSLIAILLFMILIPLAVYAADPFEISLMIFYEQGYYDGVYYAPKNDTIKVREDGPVRPFKVVVKNVSSSNQRLNFDTASGGLDLLTFEVTDENGNQNVVTKKIDTRQSRSQAYDFIAPGKTREFEITLTEGEWNNAYKLAKQGAKKCRARISYKNGSSLIYSKYYAIVFE